MFFEIIEDDFIYEFHDPFSSASDMLENELDGKLVGFRSYTNNILSTDLLVAKNDLPKIKRALEEKESIFTENSFTLAFEVKDIMIIETLMEHLLNLLQ